jgi:hypothetical protein
LVNGSRLPGTPTYPVQTHGAYSGCHLMHKIFDVPPQENKPANTSLKK